MSMYLHLHVNESGLKKAFCQFMVYVVSTHNNLNSVHLNFYVLSDAFARPIEIPIIIQFFQTYRPLWKLILSFNFHIASPPSSAKVKE
jgi:hypothetical protein